MGPEYQRQNRYKKTKRSPKLLILIGAAVLILAGGFFGWRWYRHRAEVGRQSATTSTNPQTELGNESSTTDENATNTNQQNQQLAGSTTPVPSTQSSVTLPTPLLSKSSGNNGPVPKGTVIEFICTAPAGYSCFVRLVGSKTINFNKQTLTDNGRGQAAASWDWTSQSGKWSITAILQDAKGNEQASNAQTLEVQT